MKYSWRRNARVPLTFIKNLLPLYAYLHFLQRNPHDWWCTLTQKRWTWEETIYSKLQKEAIWKNSRGLRQFSPKFFAHRFVGRLRMIQSNNRLCYGLIMVLFRSIIISSGQRRRIKVMRMKIFSSFLRIRTRVQSQPLSQCSKPAVRIVHQIFPWFENAYELRIS